MDELNYAITQVIEEEIDKYHSCIDWLSFIGRKPKAAPVKKQLSIHLTELSPPRPSTQTSLGDSTSGH
jgi:hypothetical protein